METQVLLAQGADAEFLGSVVQLTISGVAQIFVFVCAWIIFEKAGEPGWAAITPVYGSMVFMRICGKPEWWGIFVIVCPLIYIIFAIIATIALAEKFGKSGGFAVGLIFLAPIFYGILAFGDAQYEGRRKKKKKRRYEEDEDDDYQERRKPRRSRDYDEDAEDRPRRRRRDDDEDDRPRRRRRRDDDDE